jgi:acyl-CoA thioester hydrolase
MPLPIVSLEKLDALPVFHRATITAEHLDAMGHMNIRWYLAFFDEGGWPLFESLGMDEAYHRENQAGVFALQHFIHYLAEVRQGEIVTVRTRMLARSEKRLHFMSFLINETAAALACTVEGMGTHIDLQSRRSSPFPDHIAARIDALIAEHDRLDWETPVCGVIGV